MVYDPSERSSGRIPTRSVCTHPFHLQQLLHVLLPSHVMRFLQEAQRQRAHEERVREQEMLNSGLPLPYPAHTSLPHPASSQAHPPFKVGGFKGGRGEGDNQLLLDHAARNEGHREMATAIQARRRSQARSATNVRECWCGCGYGCGCGSIWGWRWLLVWVWVNMGVDRCRSLCVGVDQFVCGCG
jgi:hypothetical protein